MIERPRHPGLVSFGQQRFAPAVAACVALALGAIAAFGSPGPGLHPQLRPPRSEAQIRSALAAGPHAGDCEQCHTTHGDDQPTVYPNALTSPDDNALCARCHATAWSGGSFGGDELYRGTGHGSSTHMVWPGPDPAMRIEVDAATKCLNCHDPHGVTDALGEIPMLGLAREEKACLTCHDGSPATTDIARELRKPFRHPTGDISGRHAGPNESDPSDFGVSPLNRRHAECEDCHNPHVSRGGVINMDGTSEPSPVTLGASRVTVTNGAAGTRPLYAFVAGSDSLTTPDGDYTLCFKCHSSWTTQPSGQTDLARALNPANASYHPVEAAGRNPGISMLAFTPGWSPDSRTRCGSCHGSDFGDDAGPHGSTNAGLLRQPYKAAPDERSMSPDELCFRCHAYDAYANPAAPAEMQQASRFGGTQSAGGHVDHVGKFSVPCFACHETHGAPSQPHLIAIGRSPGMLAYTATLAGGTCTTSCHGVESYTLNYAR